jgi:hypothetical protein
MVASIMLSIFIYNRKVFSLLLLSKISLLPDFTNLLAAHEEIYSALQENLYDLEETAVILKSSASHIAAVAANSKSAIHVSRCPVPNFVHLLQIAGLESVIVSAIARLVAKLSAKKTSNFKVLRYFYLDSVK